MASGIGVNGNPGRCFEFWSSFSKVRGWRECIGVESLGEARLFQHETRILFLFFFFFFLLLLSGDAVTNKVYEGGGWQAQVFGLSGGLLGVSSPSQRGKEWISWWGISDEVGRCGLRMSRGDYVLVDPVSRRGFQINRESAFCRFLPGVKLGIPSSKPACFTEWARGGAGKEQNVLLTLGFMSPLFEIWTRLWFPFGKWQTMNEWWLVFEIGHSRKGVGTSTERCRTNKRGEGTLNRRKGSVLRLIVCEFLATLLARTY